ncbi:alpha/beta hydrolase [Cerasicoccus arenae]|uniref:Lipase n=1 Tax=Cerasicoccus arenae TaxID=424488 RepID=A0A8J3GEA6_9BACT|nr:alpha/beta hydrolase [Cerasicoccus arenae]MBK1857415.1 alpha/beta hydrolase fold domain-containing protein [Cerasicoccus arenae]GHC07856.1 lipase [Cerasicoccus arenae]
MKFPHAETIHPGKVITYKAVGDVELNLHVFYPPGHRPDSQVPAILFFFGGGWVNGTPKQFYAQSEHLASRGMVAICVEYRIHSLHQTGPQECVQDGKSAIRYVRAHASELGIDPNRIAAGGGSAGGHVAAATATVDGFNEPGEDTSVSCRPNALVLFNPVYDNGPEGFGFDRVQDYWASFSPLHNLHADMGPAIVLLGTEDQHLSVERAKEFQKAMQDLGVRSELITYEGEPHGFYNEVKYDETLREMDQFLVSLGYLEKQD